MGETQTLLSLFGKKPKSVRRKLNTLASTYPRGDANVTRKENRLPAGYPSLYLAPGSGVPRGRGVL